MMRMFEEENKTKPRKPSTKKEVIGGIAEWKDHLNQLRQEEQIKKAQTEQQ